MIAHDIFMIYVVLSILLFLPIVLMVAFFTAGIRLKCYFDLDTSALVADLYVFDRVHAIKLKAFECNSQLYYQVNAKELKKIKRKRKSKTQENAVKASRLTLNEVVGIVTNAVKQMPVLRLRELTAHLTIGTGDCMNTSVVCSSVAVLMSALYSLFGSKIKAKSFDCTVYPNFRFENTVFSCDVSMGWGLLPLTWYLFSLKRKVKKTKMKNKEYSAVEHNV